MATLENVLFVLLLTILTGCAEKNGYVEPGQQTIIDNLTETKWERKYHAKLDNGQEFDVHEIWKFEDTGKGSYKTITTYEDKGDEEIITYFNWSFTVPNFSIIYMDYPRYWTIDKLTANKLCVYQTYDDPMSVTGQKRDYREYASTN